MVVLLVKEGSAHYLVLLLHGNEVFNDQMSAKTEEQHTLREKAQMMTHVKASRGTAYTSRFVLLQKAEFENNINAAQRTTSPD